MPATYDKIISDIVMHKEYKPGDLCLIMPKVLNMANTLITLLTVLRVSLSAARPRGTDPKTPIYPTYVGIVGISILVVRRRSTTSSTMAMSRRPRTMAAMATDGRLAIGHPPGSLKEVLAEGSWAGFY